MAVDLKKTHAIIADRSRHVRDIIRDLLRDYGLPNNNIRDCASGREALELLQTRTADLLIVDGRMSPMNGLALTRYLRDPNTTSAPGIPIIYCLDTLDKKVLGEARTAGVNEVILKPVNAHAIRSRVTAVLERPRPLITLQSYVGPDRRRIPEHWDGVERRSEDNYWTIC